MVQMFRRAFRFTYDKYTRIRNYTAGFIMNIYQVNFFFFQENKCTCAMIVMLHLIVEFYTGVTAKKNITDLLRSYMSAKFVPRPSSDHMTSRITCLFI